ncbi:N2227-domain-containing protein [Ophiobolus disseminans]|uniref:N2227-domain-containing protein n=1 Tax=Ophiobolus disseminans TaxID=1469910 RepID=A0A6A6ZWR9_9PLEO|nr:N2227-domain-containing protein [Ophiobolus disseminans]
MRLSISLGLIASIFAIGAAAGNADATPTSDNNQVADATYAQDALNEAQDPLQMGAMLSSGMEDFTRYRQEKVHLLKRMNQKQGNWGTSHPRYRLMEALFGFTKYRERSMAELDRWRGLYKNVGKKQKRTLEHVMDYDKKLDDIGELIYENFMVCKSIVSNAMMFYGIEQRELDEHITAAEKNRRQADRISVSQTLKHFVRDWADGGAKERNEAFPCILSTMSNLKNDLPDSRPLKVLLPGSGLGRLGHEVANLGDFEVTINEWSMYMNLGYRFLENNTNPNSFVIHPFIDGMSHHATTSDMLRRVTAPNSSPNPSVLLVEGDFNNAFNDQGGYYDIIVTHFFIDTARNLLSYFDTIQFLLKPGGKWLNFGPLLYGTGPFVQLSLDEIIAVVKELGFEFEDIGDECGELTFEGEKIKSKEAEYGFNGKALTKNAYAAQVWVATRK